MNPGIRSCDPAGKRIVAVSELEYPEECQAKDWDLIEEEEQDVEEPGSADTAHAMHGSPVCIGFEYSRLQDLGMESEG